MADWNDGLALRDLERRRFRGFAAPSQQQLPIYDCQRFCENRMGWLLRAVYVDPAGSQPLDPLAYAVAQIRRDEMYLYEFAAVGGPAGRHRPGRALYHVLVRVAAQLGLARVTCLISRPDTRAPMLRLMAEVGMVPAGERGFTLTGSLPPPGWQCLHGKPAEIVARHEQSRAEVRLVRCRT